MSAAGEVGRKSRALWCDTVVRLASALKDDVLGHSSGEKAVRWMHGHHMEKKQRKTTSRRCTMSKRPENYRIYVVRAAHRVVTDLLRPNRHNRSMVEKKAMLFQSYELQTYVQRLNKT